MEMVAKNSGMDAPAAVGGENGNGGTNQVPVILTAVIGMAIAATVGWLLDAEHGSSVQGGLEQQADRSVGRLQEAFSVNQETLFSIGSFFESSEAVSRLEFGTFVRRSFEREGVLLAFGWVPLIGGTERAELVGRARADGLQNYEVRERDAQGGYVPAKRREVHAPIYYAEPMREYHDVLGVDLWTEPVRRRALERARDEGRPVAAEPVRSVRNDQPETRLIAYLPVYRKDSPRETMEERRQAIAGFASAVFSFDRLLERATRGLDSGIAVELFDLEKNPETAISAVGTALLTGADRRRTVTEEFELAGRRWGVGFTPTGAYYGAHPNVRTWLGVCVCLAFTTILCAWVHSMAVRQARISQVVNDRTSELIITNAALKQENRVRRSAEKTNQKKSSELETLNSELESFSYSISHDLRAPLRAITGFTGFVLRKYRDQLPEDAVHHLDQVMKGGNQMNDLIEGLLQFSRIQRAELKRRNCNMGELARGLMADLQTTMPERRVDVIWGKLPAAFADPTLIRQVWQNLLSNALKYTGKRPSAIIEVGAKMSDDGETVYYVKDNGAGFDMSQSERLFGVFQRFHAQSQFEGTGIGLANVSKIIQRHGGRIWAEAEVDQGARFYFVLGTDASVVSKPGDSTIMQAPQRKSS